MDQEFKSLKSLLGNEPNCVDAGSGTGRQTGARQAGLLVSRVSVARTRAGHWFGERVIKLGPR
jgi:hypothetical protein